jgi:outer membrane protein TolC
MKISYLLGVLLTISAISWSQESISLKECYDLINTNYPMTKQFGLLDSQNSLDAKAINKSRLPQFNLSAQATYQSEVIEVPIPNSNIKPLNKDQYRATLTVNQLIYAGGLIDAQEQLKEVQTLSQKKQVEVNLYQLKTQVNQLYFSILLMQEKHALLLARERQLKEKLSEVRSGVKNGVLLPSSDKILEVELLKIQQQFMEIDANKKTLMGSLSSLLDVDLKNTTSFETPLVLIENDTTLLRPEIELFDLKKLELDNSEKLLSKTNSPKLSSFVTGGYGNPGLNMLDNSFQTFYIAGLQLNWNVFDWNKTKVEKQSLAINKDIIDNEKEIFDLNISMALDEQLNEITKINSLIAADENIIILRKDVLKMKDSQLNNGVITTSDYLTEFINLCEDENTLATHKIQLELAKANYNIIKGQ